MFLNTTSPPRDISEQRLNAAAQSAVDRRRYRRVAIPLLGRFMRENKSEYPCKLTDISAGGASILSPIQLELGERVVVYFDDIGGLNGHVVRDFDAGFAIAIKASAYRREKLAATLTWLANRERCEGLEARRHTRLSADNNTVELHLSDGSVENCRMLDISVSGASVETRLRPLLGTEITLGKQRAIVRRHHENGIGIQFIKEQPADVLKSYVR